MRLPFALRPRHLLLVALLLGAGLRLSGLDAMPPGLYHDEAYNGLDALSLLQGKTFPQFYEGWELYAGDAQAERLLPQTRTPLFFAGNYGREPLHVYLMALSISLLGATPTAVRLVPALAGVLGILTTYWAAGALLGADADRRRLVPPLAAFFVAILFPAVHFSRFGLRAMLFVPVSTLAVACFWWGINRPVEQRRRTYLLLTAAGFFLGLGIYVYAAGRLLPLLWLIFIPLWFWRERGTLRRFWAPVGVMSGVSLLTALPLLLFFARYPYFFTFRIAYVANRGAGTVPGRPWLTWLLNVGRVIAGLFWQGETHLRHNLPERPYLDFVQVPLFLTGLVTMVRARGGMRHLFLGLWLLIMLLPTILSGDAPHFGRMTGAVAPIALLLALGAEQLIRLLRRRLPADRVMLLTAPLLALSAGITIFDYFGRYAAHPQIAADFYLPEWELGQFAAGQPAETVLYLSPTQEELATFYFALADPARLRDFNGEAGALPMGPGDRPVVYMLRDGQTATLSRLQRWFPEGEIIPAPPGITGYQLPAAVAPPTEMTGDVVWGEAIRLQGYTVQRDGPQLQVTLAWTAQRALDVDYTAFVHVVGPDGALLAQTDRQPAGYPTGAWRPGEIVLDTFIVALPESLPADLTLQTGFYDLATLTPLGPPAPLIPAAMPGGGE